MLLLFEVTGKAEGTVDAVEFYDAALDKICSTQERTHTSPYAFITHYITLSIVHSFTHTHTHTHTHNVPLTLSHSHTHKEWAESVSSAQISISSFSSNSCCIPDARELNQGMQSHKHTNTHTHTHTAQYPVADTEGLGPEAVPASLCVV